jgi:serine/threonine protein kinase
MPAESCEASIAWCAPEQLIGSPCTPATDIFAMGVRHLGALHRVPTTPYRNYRAVIYPREAPEAIANLIKRCMEFEPANRPDASKLHDTIMASDNAGTRTVM